MSIWETFPRRDASLLPGGNVTHFQVLFRGAVVGFFESLSVADGVAGLLGVDATVDEVEGEMPSNDELSGKGADVIELRPRVVDLDHRRAVSGFHRGV